MSVTTIRSRPSFAASVRVQARIIRALTVREAVAHNTTKTLGFFWVVADPLILTCGVIVLWSFTGRSEGHQGVSVYAMALSAYTHIQLWRLMVNTSLTTIHHNAWLFYHRNVHVFDLLVARALLQCVAIFTSFVVISTVLMLFGVLQPYRDPGLILAAWGLDTLFDFSFTVFIAGIAAQNEYVEKLAHPVMYLTLPISGAFFMTAWMPPKFRAVLEWIPLAECAEMFRAGMFSLSVKTYWGVPNIVVWSLFFIVAGLPILQMARRKVEVGS
ncbi:MAG: ABC transporter permease [Hyphomicrobiales bacterium]|nr:ABC transporter permease [Hyphomicrobiales bacterium]